MKRAVVLLTVLIIMMIQIPAYGLTLVEHSNYGDRVNILGDIRVVEKTLGDIVSIGGNVDVENSVNGDVVVIFGNVRINAKVNGDVVSILGRVILTDKAEIAGDLVSLGSISRSNSAVIYGTDTIIRFGDAILGNFNMDTLITVKSVMLIISLLLTVLLGLPILTIGMKRFQNIELTIELGIGRKLVIGFLGLIASFLIMLIFSWTVVIPLVYILMLFIAKMVAAIYFGKILVKIFNSRLNIHLEFITGVVAVALIKIILLILLPREYLIQGILGNLSLNLILNSLGIGILFDSKFGQREF